MEILRVKDVGLAAAAAKAAAVIRGGGIVVYPTDTIYGIGVNALDAGAIMRLKALKGRETKKPISIIVPHVEALERYAVLTESARALAEKHLPGALTLVVPARDDGRLPAELILNGAVGFRIPDDAFVRAFSEASEHPITTTSANLSAHQTPATIPEIILQFGPRIKDINLFIDDGPRAGGVPSTVVLCVGDSLRILREGAISRETLGL